MDGMDRWMDGTPTLYHHPADIDKSLIIHLNPSRSSSMLSSEGQTFQVTSCQKCYFPIIRHAVAVAMGTSDWVFLFIFFASDWVVHFAWMHKAKGWFWGIHVCCCVAITTFGTGLCCYETSLWNLEFLLPLIVISAGRQCSLYSSSEAHIVPIEGISAVTPFSLQSATL